VIAEIAHRLEDAAQAFVVADVVANQIGVSHGRASLCLGSQPGTWNSEPSGPCDEQRVQLADKRRNNARFFLLSHWERPGEGRFANFQRPQAAAVRETACHALSSAGKTHAAR
jgi:hypothetical protein